MSKSVEVVVDLGTLTHADNRNGCLRLLNNARALKIASIASDTLTFSRAEGTRRSITVQGNRAARRRARRTT